MESRARSGANSAVQSPRTTRSATAAMAAAQAQSTTGIPAINPNSPTINQLTSGFAALQPNLQAAAMPRGNDVMDVDANNRDNVHPSYTNNYPSVRCPSNQSYSTYHLTNFFSKGRRGRRVY